MTIDGLRIAWLEMAANRLRPEELPRIATDALVRGLDSPALRELAGAPAWDVWDNRDLFVAAMHELGHEDLVASEALWDLLRHWASAVTEGTLDVREAAGLLWGSWTELDDLQESSAVDEDLLRIGALVDDWDELPARRPEIEADILEAAAELLRALDGRP